MISAYGDGGDDDVCGDVDGGGGGRDDDVEDEAGDGGDGDGGDDGDDRDDGGGESYVWSMCLMADLRTVIYLSLIYQLI